MIPHVIYWFVEPGEDHMTSTIFGSIAIGALSATIITALVFGIVPALIIALIGLGVLAGLSMAGVAYPASSKSGDGLPSPRGPVKQKRKRVAYLLDLIEKNGGSITNLEVQKLMHVSSATAERYLDELESDQKIVQVGSTGRNVEYRLQ